MSAEYVYRMEDLLETYATPDTPDTPDTPLVCLDEKPVTLHADLYAGTPPTAGPAGPAGTGGPGPSGTARLRLRPPRLR